MYSGLTIHGKSGNIVGTHQKFDRVAFRILEKHYNASQFPDLKSIIHFEGKNGPDGIKSKSPSKDEPWHYFDPTDPEDKGNIELIDIIQNHYNELVKQLKAKNLERSAFEASWLAHALVDGLTPAHHYPYEKELEKLRSGASKESRDTVRKKLVMPGDTRLEKIRNNWKAWGAKGLLTTHGMFEMGVASIVSPLRIKGAAPSDSDFAKFSELGLDGYFTMTATEIAKRDIYGRFYEKGWTSKLAQEIREFLAPEIVKAVSLAWMSAYIESGMAKD